MNNNEKIRELLEDSNEGTVYPPDGTSHYKVNCSKFIKALALLKQEPLQTVFIVTENHQSDSNVAGVFTEKPLADAEAVKNVGDALYGCSVHEWTVQDCVSPAKPCATCGGSKKRETALNGTVDIRCRACVEPESQAPDHIVEPNKKVDVSEFVAKIRQDLEYSCTWIGMNKDIRELCDRLEAAKKEIEKWMAMVEKRNAWYDKAMDAMKKSNDFKTKLKAETKRADAAENVNDIREAEIEQLHDKLQTSDELVFAYQSVRAPINPLFAKLKTAEDALQALYDEQNGPPLIRDRDSWQAAMDKAEQALGEGSGSDG